MMPLQNEHGESDSRYQCSHDDADDGRDDKPGRKRQYYSKRKYRLGRLGAGYCRPKEVCRPVKK